MDSKSWADRWFQQLVSLKQLSCRWNPVWITRDAIHGHSSEVHFSSKSEATIPPRFLLILLLFEIKVLRKSKTGAW